MWFATETGVSFYNAMEWKNYSTVDGLPDEEYFFLGQDKQNIIWAVPDNMRGQIAFFKDRTWNLIDRIPDNISKNTLTSFEIIYEGNNIILCLGTLNGLYLYKNNRWRVLTSENGLPDNRINSLCRLNNKLFVCTGKGISIYSNGQFNELKINSPTKRILAAHISAKDNNILWLMGDNWIGRYINQSFELLYKDSRNIFNHSYKRHGFITYDNVERIFCGNEYEMYLFDLKKKRLSLLTQDNGFATNGCTKAYLDSENNLWFTTYRGIDKISNQRFRNYYKANGLFENEVSAIIEVNKDHYLFGHNNGITIYRDGNFKTIDFQKYISDSIKNFRVMGFCKDANNTVWLASSQLGVGYIINDRIKWIKYKTSARFDAIASDNDGTVWIGSDYGLYKIENNKMILVASGNQGFKIIRKLYFDKNNILYVSLKNGFIKYSNGKIIKYDERKLKSASNVYSICDYENSTKLIGTKNGLFILYNDSIHIFNSENFKNNKKVYAIERSNEKTYWFGTNDGVIKWDKKGSVNYGIENGLTGREINRSSIITDSYGNTWIGTDRGLSCYSPDYERNDSIRNVTIEKIENSNGVITDLNNEVNLPSPLNELVFHFRAVSFINEEAIEYKVMLHGFDSNWINNGHNTFIRYTNLKPGNYRFAVKARNISGNWSKISYSQIIIVNKQFFLQWWFMVLAILFLTFLIYLIYNYRFQIKYSSQLEKEVELRTDKLKKSQYELEQSNLAKDKFFSIIAHDLKSPFQGLLGLINYMSSKYNELREDDIKEYLMIIKDATTKLLELIVQLLEWSRIQTGNMEFNPKDFSFCDEVIIPSVSLLKVNADAKEITIENKISDKLFVRADVNSYRLIVDNLLSNAIKFTETGGKISIDVIETDGYYEISITDSGIGMQRSKIDKLFLVGENASTIGTVGEIGTGLGLILCKELLEKNGNKISVISEPGKGSTFTFTIEKVKPIKLENL
ncbi:MAG: hypothetical protein C4539_08565 [Ignavibacteriales bacterium]|nr:MAG: hypothetical protein C4539_08565 [Ignavibacteriales bacterium]